MCWWETCESAGVISRNRAFYILPPFFFSVSTCYSKAPHPFIHSLIHSTNILRLLVSLCFKYARGFHVKEDTCLPSNSWQGAEESECFMALQKKTMFAWHRAPSLLGSKSQHGLWSQTIQGINPNSATHRCHCLGKLFVLYKTYFSRLQWKSY